MRLRFPDKFTASSGNVAEFLITGKTVESVVVRVIWDVDPSAVDQQEADAAVMDLNPQLREKETALAASEEAARQSEGEYLRRQAAYEARN